MQLELGLNTQLSSVADCRNNGVNFIEIEAEYTSVKSKKMNRKNVY